MKPNLNTPSKACVYIFKLLCKSRLIVDHRYCTDNFNAKSEMDAIDRILVRLFWVLIIWIALSILMIIWLSKPTLPIAAYILN
ncbi:hypothetical protein R1T16_05585 [Flavobacterium sp. DG1-102-2]|uniref:hypothetical protein n=1 Tax=Flavobacterium sp. DG1-102-2 TaxID=3081663 RepID=UPI0029491AA9|nr:hypothetical protein [Flavobacterium sp. DG1-102-2]MDV6167887.1 hypothetical protein [Flavobacterium sp. DG1-102-2]